MASVESIPSAARDTEHTEVLEGNEHTGCDDGSGNGGGLISEGKSHDDGRGSTRGGRSGNLSGGSVGVRGVVLRDKSDETSTPKTCVRALVSELSRALVSELSRALVFEWYMSQCSEEVDERKYESCSEKWMRESDMSQCSE